MTEEAHEKTYGEQLAEELAALPSRDPEVIVDALENEAHDLMEYMYQGGQMITKDAALTGAVFEKTMTALILQLRANRIQLHADLSALMEKLSRP